MSLFALQASFVAAQWGPSLDDAAARVRTRCAAIPPAQGKTGMIFNQKGLETVYDRSECYQDAAVQLGEPALCELALERKSLLFDGSSVSPRACRELVAKRTKQDQAKAADIHAQSVSALALRRNGNGRDWDLLIDTSGGSSYPHRRIVTLITPRQVVLSDEIQPMGKGASQLEHTLSGPFLRNAIGGGPPSFAIRVELRLEPRSLDERRAFKLAPPLLPSSRTIFCEMADGLVRCAENR